MVPSAGNKRVNNAGTVMLATRECERILKNR